MVGRVLASALLALCPAAAAPQDPPRPELLVADFESEGWAGWRAEGAAFGDGPAQGTLPGQMEVSGFEGERLVNSYFGGDGPTGTLTSPPFRVARRYLVFRIGGGGFPGETCLELLVDGAVVRAATGPNTQPGGSERLSRVHWEVGEFEGREAVLRIVDARSGGWGHVNVDDIRQADAPAGVTPEELMRGPSLDTFADYAATGYDQPLRPQFHFSSRRNWHNDPNGLVYLDGEYHLYFQHNPLGVQWGNMSWGHAVSPDLVHWTQLPHAILPYDGGTIYSGTAAVDRRDTLGVAVDGAPVLLAAYTFAREPFGQALAWSTDRGRSFTLVDEGRPVVPNQGYDPGERDPKLLWHAPSQRWVMVLWGQRGEPGRVLFLQSQDLRRWEVVGRFDRDWVFECMDLVELPDPREPGRTRWLIYDASFDYEVGDFDGRSFTSDGVVRQGDLGPNYYAAQTWSDAPDGRRTILGWMYGPGAPFVEGGMPFNQQMSFPADLALEEAPDGGLRLLRWPVAEIEGLVERRLVAGPCRTAAARSALGGFEAELLDLELEVEAAAGDRFAVELRGLRVEYADGAFRYGGRVLPAPPRDGAVHLRVLLDRTSLELFADRGAAVATFYAVPDPAARSVRLEADDALPVRRLEARRLRSAWPSAEDAGAVR